MPEEFEPDAGGVVVTFVVFDAAAGVVVALPEEFELEFAGGVVVVVFDAGTGVVVVVVLPEEFELGACVVVVLFVVFVVFDEFVADANSHK